VPKWESTIAKITEIINSNPYWGVKVNRWELARKAGEPLAVILFFEVNREQLRASFAFDFSDGRVIFEGMDYLFYPLKYRTLEYYPEGAALPITAFLLGYYLKEIIPISASEVFLYPNLSEAKVGICWWGKTLSEPGLSAKIIVKEKEHKVVVTYYPESWSRINITEIETDIFNAPQVVKAGIALIAL
jgi:hypothetical protein